MSEHDDRWPTVSAVVATRDRLELLRQAVAAILAQDYPGAIDVVVVFDHSQPDHSLARDGQQRRVRVVTNTRTPGLAGARNRGVLAATGSLVAFCDDDDTWLPHKLTRQVQLLQAQPHTDVVMGGMVIDYEGRRIERVLRRPQLELRDLLRSRVQEAHPSTILVRRAAFLDRIGLVDEAIPGGYGEDHDWLIRAARLAPIAMVAEPVVVVLWHSKSFFADRWRMIAEAMDYLAAKHAEFADEPVGLARLYGRKSFALAASGQRREALRWAVRSLRTHWRDARALATLVVSTGLVKPETAMRLANATGRGI